MMKLPIIAGAMVLAFVAEGAMAACSAPAASQVKNGDVTTLLSGNTVCASRAGDTWQEEHHADSTLWDYKMGDGHAVDPRKQLGNWAVTGNGAGTSVVYTYTGGSTFTYEVWDNGGGSYSFCGVDTLDFALAATVAGTKVCP